VKRFDFRLRGGRALKTSPVVDFFTLILTEQNGQYFVSPDLATEREIDDWATEMKAAIDAAVKEAKSAFRQAS
jgi:hypothetical protein